MQESENDFFEQVEKKVLAATLDCEGDPEALRSWKKRQRTPDETRARNEARFDGDRSAEAVARRREARRREVRLAKQRRNRNLLLELHKTQLTASKGPSKAPQPLIIGEEATLDRDEWTTGLHDHCLRTFAEDSGRRREKRESPGQRYERLAREAKEEGPPETRVIPTLAEILNALAEAATNKTPGEDQVTSEMWKMLPFEAKIRIAIHMRRHLVGEGHARPWSWKLLVMVAVAKHRGPCTLEDHRFLALTSTMSKWYLRVVVLTFRKDEERLPPREVHTLGFTTAKSTAHLTHAVRLALQTAALWKGVGVVIAVMDIQQYFDNMDHADMLGAMERRGYRKWILRALQREMLGLWGEATVADADPSQIFPFRKGGRTGGVETPFCANVMLEEALREEVRTWNAQGLGFNPQQGSDEQQVPFNHAIWADNVVLLANSPDQLQRMINGFTRALQKKLHMTWKPSSLEVMYSRGYPKTSRRELETVDQAGRRLIFAEKTKITLLGDIMDDEGGSQPAREARRAQADKVYFRHAHLLERRELPIPERRAFVKAPAASAEYAAQTWTWNMAAALESRSWETRH